MQTSLRLEFIQPSGCTTRFNDAAAQQRGYLEELKSMLTSMAVNQQREGMKDHYAFWETQPVAQFTDRDENMPVSLAVPQACSLPVWWATTPSPSALRPVTC